MDTPSSQLDVLEESFRTTRTSWIVLGTVGLLTGLAALAMPGLAALATTIVVAVALGIGGIAHLVHAFQVRKWWWFFANLMLAAAYIVPAALILARPLVGALSLAILASVWCIAVGAVEIVAALREPHLPGWGWLLLSGIAGIALGVLILSGWPAGAVYTVGLLVGVNLVVTGISELMVGLSIPRIETHHPPSVPA